MVFELGFRKFPLGNTPSGVPERSIVAVIAANINGSRLICRYFVT